MSKILTMELETDKKGHDIAWQLLDEHGLTLGEKMKVRTLFVEWARETPQIGTTFTSNGKIEYYHSLHKPISHLMFSSEKKVILADAIFLNMTVFNIDEFRGIFKYTCRLIGID